MTAFVQIDGAAAVITGAGSGIGRATRIRWARRGARVVVSDVLAERAEAVAAEIVAVRWRRRRDSLRRDRDRRPGGGSGPLPGGLRRGRHRDEQRWGPRYGST